MPADARLEAALAWSRSELRRGSRSFWSAGLLLPADVRDAFAVIYAFCRSADDAMDCGTADAATLAALQQRVDRIYAGQEPLGPGDYALAWLVGEAGIPRTVFDALIEGFAWELEGRRYESIHDLYGYAARVASAVGAAVTLVMGCSDRETLARACDLGVAMQLTNIARDVGEDARNGRLYLPRQWLLDEGVDPDAFLRSPRFTPAVGHVVRRVLAEAELLYARAEPGIACLPARCRPAIHAARHLYEAIGAAIAARGYDSVGTRAVTTGSRKAWLLLKAMAAPRRRRSADAGRPPLRETRFLVEAASHP